MAEIASPISGGIRAVRSTVTSNILTGGARPQQEQQQPQVDGATTRLLSRNSLLLNSVVVQLGSVTQQVTGLRNSLEVLKENLIVESRLERLREQANAVRENQLAEQQIREGGESTIEKKIQSNLIRPFSKIASKAQLTLNRLGSFFTTLFFGWLTTNTVRAIGALGDGSRDKFNEIISGVGKVLLVLGGAFIASKIGIGKLLSSIITFNFKLKKFSAVGIITAPFRWIGNIIGAIINRIGNLFPWILPGFIYNQQNKKTETDKLDSNNDSTEKIQAKNEGGLIDFKGKLNEIMNSTEELNIPTIKPDESQPLYFDERLKLFDEQTNILRDQNTKLNENNKTFGNNVFKLKENFNEIFFGIEPINKEDTSVGVTTSNTAIPPVEKWEPPENKSYVDFGFNETGSSGAIMPSSTVIEEKKDKIQTYNQEEDTSPIIIPMETAGNDNSQGSIDGSTLPSETNSVPPVGAINYDNLYVFNTYKVFQISPKMI